MRAIQLFLEPPFLGQKKASPRNEKNLRKM
jgi:hypothetical protein